MSSTPKNRRYGMVIDIDRCTGCGACAIACAVENNVPPAHAGATERTGLTWMQISRVENGGSFPETDTAFIPVLCQHCENETPCVAVCPQNAVELDKGTGIVGQIPQRCLGCRYCMTACPYHARFFNWRDPEWPAGMERTFNPDVAPRMRGVVEKCNLCHGRLHAAREKAAHEGQNEINPADYIPACVENCPAHAIIFGNLEDSSSPVAAAAEAGGSFRILERLDTGSKVYYSSKRPWVRKMLETAAAGKEAHNG